MSQHKYAITPSLLGAFQNYLDSELEFEGDFNRDSEGEYKLSLEEVTANLEQKLLDYINKVPQEPSEAADKGTCFNEALDRIILGTKDGREDIEVHSGMVMLPEGETKAVFASSKDFGFCFDLGLCLGLAQELRDAVPQHYCEAILPTKYGDVLLYGYIDYVLQDKVIDLKTTKRYAFPKFDKGWQKWLYPYCLIESGEMDDVAEFDYLVVQWRELVNKPISGAVYKEPYSYRHEYAKQQLTSICEHFIEWLEARRDYITTTKIFGGE